MSLAETCDCDLTIGGIHRFTRKSYNEKLANDMIGGLVDIGFEPRTSGGKPAQKLAAIRPLLPNTKTDTFKANTHGTMLKRISKSLAKSGSKARYVKGGGEETFASTAEEIRDNIVATGGTMAHDFIEIKKAIETRLNNLKDCLVVLEKVLLETRITPADGPSEFKTYKKLLKEVIDMAKKEISILAQSYDIETHSLDHIIRKNADMKKTLEMYQVKPGSAATGKLLAQYLHGMANIADTALLVQKYLKDLNLTLKDYESLNYSEMQKKALLLSGNTLKKKAQVIDIIRHLASFDTKKKGIVKEIKGGNYRASGLDSSKHGFESGGSVEPFLPKSYESKVKEESKQLDQLNMAYSAQLKEIFSEVYKAMDVFVKLIGKEVKYDDHFAEFVLAYSKLSEIDSTPNLKAILGFTNDHTSVTTKSRYLNDTSVAIAKMKALKVSGEAETKLNKIIKLLEEFLKLVETYGHKKEATEKAFGGKPKTAKSLLKNPALKDSSLKRRLPKDKFVPVGGSLGFSESVKSLEYYADLNKLKSTMVNLAKGFEKDTKDFDKLLYNALEEQKNINDKERKKAIAEVEANKANLGPNADLIKDHVVEYLDHAYLVKSKMWLVAQAVEIYLKHFNYLSLTEYDDFIELREILDPIKIIKDTSSATVAALIEPDFKPKDHNGDYYAYLFKQSATKRGVAGPSANDNIFKPFDESIAVINKDFRWADYKEKIKDAGQAFNLLKNVIAIFTRIGDKIGKTKQIELRKKTSMTPTQIWEALYEFLFMSFYGVYYDGIMGVSIYNMDRLFSVSFSNTELFRSLGNADSKYGKFRIGVESRSLSSDMAVFFTPRNDALCPKVISSVSNKLFLVKEYTSPDLILQTDADEILKKAPHNDNFSTGIDFSSKNNRNAIQWFRVVKKHPFPGIQPQANYEGWTDIIDSLKSIRRVKGASATALTIPNNLVGNNNYSYLAFDNQYIIRGNGTRGSINDVATTFSSAIATGNFGNANLLELSNIPVVLSHLLIASELENLFNNYRDFMAWYYSTLFGKVAFGGINLVTDNKIDSIVPRFEDNLSSRFIKEFSTPAPLGQGVHDKISPAVRPFIDLLFPSMQILYPIGCNGDQIAMTSKLGDIPGAIKLIEESYKDLKKRYGDLMDRIKASWKKKIKDDGAISAVHKAAEEIIEEIDITSRFFILSNTGAIIAGSFDLDEYDDNGGKLGTVNFNAGTQIWGDTTGDKVNDGLYLAIKGIGLTNAKRATTNDRHAWEILDCNAYFNLASINGDAAIIFDKVTDATANTRQLDYTAGVANCFDLMQIPDLNELNVARDIVAIETYFAPKESLMQFGFNVNVVTSEKKPISGLTDKRYLLARDGASGAIIDPVRKNILKGTLIKPIVSFGQEHALFRTIIKAMFAKVNSAIGIHNIFNVPGALSKFSPERIIMGAANYSETIEGAIELYIRLPPYIEFYKKVFLAQKDIDKPVFNFDMAKIGNKENDFSITFLPEMRGTCFGGLFDVLWRKIDESEFYSEVECAKIIEECNHIYDKFKGPNMVFNCITDLVSEVNARYGKTKITDIEYFKKYVKETTDYESSYDDSTNILPGEDEVDIPGALPINPMGSTAALDESYYNMKNTKNLIYDFMSRLVGYLDSDTDKGLDKKTFRTFIKNIDAEYRHAKDPREKFEIVVRGIRGINTNVSSTSIINIVMHELVTTPLNILSEILLILKENLRDLENFDLKTKFMGVYEELKKKAPGGTNKLDYVLLQLGTGLKGIIPRIDATHTVKSKTIIKKDFGNEHMLTTAEGGPINKDGKIRDFNEYLKAIDALAGPDKMQGTVNMTIAAIMEVVDWGEQYGLLLDRLGALSDLNLFTVKVEGNKVTFEYSEFKSRVESILEQTKQLIDFFRYDIDVKSIEEKYFRLEKELYKEIILGKDSTIGSINNLKTYINEGRELLTTYELECGNALLKRAKYSTIDSSSAINNTKNNSILSALTTKAKAALGKDDKDKDKKSGEIDFVLKSKKLWENDKLSVHNSLLLQFNSLIDHFLKDIFDWSTNKIYGKLLYSLTAGSLTTDIQLGYKTFNPSLMKAKSSLIFDLFERGSTDNILVNNVSYLLNLFVSSYTKTNKTYLLDNFSELSDPYKEKLKNTLPLYIQLLSKLVNKAKLLKECFPETKIYNIDFSGLGLGPFKAKDLTWSQGNRVTDLVYDAAIAVIPSGGATYENIRDAAFPEIKSVNLHTDPSPTTAGAKVEFDKYRLRNKSGSLIVMNGVGAAWTNSIFADIVKGVSDPDFYNDWIRSGYFEVGKDKNGVGTSVYDTFIPTKKLIKARNVQRRSFERIITSMGLEMDKPYDPSLFIKGTQANKYNELISYIDKISSNTSGLISNIDTVLKELDDVPLHGELNQRFIEQYKSLNGKIPFMPLSITSYHYTHDEMFPEYGSDEFKLSYATRGVRGALNLKKIDMDAFPVLDGLLDEYAGVYKKIDKKLIETLLESITYMSRYLCFYKSNAALYGRTYDRKPGETTPIFATKEVNFSLKQTLDLIESSDQNKQKGILGGNEQGAGKDDSRDTIVKINILDLNINPLSILALYRQIPFLGLNIFAFNCDLVIAKTLNFPPNTAERYHNFIRKDPALADHTTLFNMLLTSETPEVLTDKTYVKLIADVFKAAGAESKIYKDNYFKEEVISSLLLISKTASGSKNRIAGITEDIGLDGSDKIKLVAPRASHPFSIRVGDDATKDIAICTIGSGIAGDADQGLRALIEGMHRMNLFGIQQLHFIEVMYNMTKEYLVKQILVSQAPEDPSNRIISSTNILSEYLNIGKP